MVKRDLQNEHVYTMYPCAPLVNVTVISNFKEAEQGSRMGSCGRDPAWRVPVLAVVSVMSLVSALPISSSDGPRDDYRGFRIPFEGWACPELTALPESKESFFREYIQPRKPVIIRGAVEQLRWPRQAANWTDEFLCESAGSDVVSVVVRESIHHRSSNNRMPMPLCKFIKERNPLKYVTQFQGPRKDTWPVASWMPKFTPFFTVPYFYDYNFASVNMWLGYPADSGSDGRASATTNAHFDGPDNLFTVLSGQKTFHLWDPSSARGLYTYAPVITIAPDGDMIMGKASNPDLPRAFKNPYTLQRPKTSQVPMHITNASIDAEVNRLFPLFASQTKRAVCVVNPGDMIYFPGCYFHEVVSKGRHLGINFWIKRDRRGQFRSRDKGLGADTQLPPAGIHSPLSGLHVSSITMK